MKKFYEEVSVSVIALSDDTIRTSRELNDLYEDDHYDLGEQNEEAWF